MVKLLYGRLHFMKQAKLLIMILLSTLDLLAAIGTPSEAIAYLNHLRERAGMTILRSDERLNAAAMNHVAYMRTNNITSHCEEVGRVGFTGVTPNDRAHAVSFLSPVTENLSSGQTTVRESIDGLLSAIYHRFGFLDPAHDLIGAGVGESAQSTYFSYSMGNSALEALCAGPSFEGWGYNYDQVCADANKKIEATAFEESTLAASRANPPLILWPYPGQAGVSPVFFEEDPDPLPQQSVSGYPVSVEFNIAYFPEPPKLLSFRLYDDQEEVENTWLLSKTNDPNRRLSSWQYALFPLERLKWDHDYRVYLAYESNATVKELSWHFRTAAPFEQYYVVETTATTLNLRPNQTYAIYFPPTNKNDTILGFRYSYEGDIDVLFDYYDGNTILVRLNGNVEDSVTLTLSPSYRQIHLVIASSDSALHATSLATIPFKRGWSLAALATDGSLSSNDLSGYFGSAKLLWKYHSGSWQLYRPESSNNEFPPIRTLAKGEGFWVKTERSFDLTIPGQPYRPELSGLFAGWHLLGTGEAISSRTLLMSALILWHYKQDGWEADTTDEALATRLREAGYRVGSFDLTPGEGFWVYLR
ncbi:MAG: CAP domain-containing protein [Campylobacterales bacterium]